MKDVTKFIGLDVSKESISVGVANAGRGELDFTEIYGGSLISKIRLETCSSP